MLSLGYQLTGHVLYYIGGLDKHINGVGFFVNTIKTSVYVPIWGDGDEKNFLL